MKKPVLLLLFFLGSTCCALLKAQMDLSVYVGFGTAYTPNYAIQGFLQQNGIPGMDHWLIGTEGGMLLKGKKLLLELGAYGGTGKMEDGLRGNRQRMFSVHLAGYYPVLLTKSFGLDAGLRIAALNQGAVLNFDPDTVNFQSNAFNSRGVLSLYNNQITLGPVVRMNFMSIFYGVIAYDISLYKAPWEVMGAQTQNAPREQNHFLRLGLSVSLNSGPK